MTMHQGLPVAGYKPQSEWAVNTVNDFKVLEENILHRLDLLSDYSLADDSPVDHRWLAIGRTQLEQAFMAINRSVFRPGRVGGKS